MRDGKRQKWKEKAKINLSILVFLFHNILGHSETLKVYTKFKDSGSHGGGEICDS